MHICMYEHVDIHLYTCIIEMCVIDVCMCRIVERLSWGRVLQVACGGHHNLVLMESELHLYTLYIHIYMYIY